LLRQVAEAGHALHEAGVIHRDIKPGNIMVNETGNRAVLVDLGLAQLADQVQGKLTRTRQFVGTLRYASPEQILAVDRVDCRSDVYSLGVTLWELLTLRPLFDATEEMPTPELMRRIQYEEPERPRRYNPAIPADLQVLVLKCLEKNAARRYGSAAELADELRAILCGEPIRARPIPPWERVVRFARRRRPSVGVVLTVLLAFCCGILLLKREHGQEPAPAASTSPNAAMTSANPTWGEVLEIPFVTWGGDVATLDGNGGLLTVPGSIFDRLHLKLRLSLGDDFEKQIVHYLDGQSPFLRGNLTELALVSDRLCKEPHTHPVVFLQLTWSAGDHLVSRAACRSLSDLKGKRIALGRNGQHKGMLDDILRTAGLSWSDIVVEWADDVTGAHSPARIFREDGTIDACCVITPDMVALTGGLDKNGNGTEGTVAGAHVLVSTAQMRRSIADVYACRKDFFDTNKDRVERIIAGYLRACDEVIEARKEKKTMGPIPGRRLGGRYMDILQLARQIYGKEVLPTEDEADGLLADAIFVGLPGNISFFTDPGNLSGFEAKQRAAFNLAVAHGNAKKRWGFLRPDLDFAKLRKLSGLRADPTPGPRFLPSLSPATENAVTSFSITFSANQMGFEGEPFQKGFLRVTEQASLFGNGKVLVRGHADPSKILQDFVRVGLSKGLLTRKETGKGDIEYHLKDGTRMKALTMAQVVELIEKGQFDTPADNLKESLRSLQELSAARAAAVRRALIEFALVKHYRLDESQVQAVGVGILEPVVDWPRGLDDGERNRRIEFRIVKREFESNDRDYDY
jgi:hypothetical protein